MLNETSKSLLPITTSLRAPNSAAREPAVASTAPEPLLPAVANVAEPVLLVCLMRIEPAAVVVVVANVSPVSSASETVIHAVT